MTLPATMTFEFDGKPPRMGVPVVNGHKVMGATSMDVHLDWESLPVVTLALLPVDELKIMLEDSRLKVRVDDATREALVSLGWTPPADA